MTYDQFIYTLLAYWYVGGLIAFTEHLRGDGRSPVFTVTLWPLRVVTPLASLVIRVMVWFAIRVLERIACNPTEIMEREGP